MLEVSAEAVRLMQSMLEGLSDSDNCPTKLHVGCSVKGCHTWLMLLVLL